MGNYNIGRIGLRIRGAYNAEIPYEKLDVVRLNGSSYVAKEDSIGVSVADTNKWMLLCGGSEATDYLSTEVATGSYWLDGKMIFSKMYVKENAANGTVYSLPIDVEYDKAWIDPTACFCENANGTTYSLSLVTAGSARAFIAYIKRNNNTINVLTEVGTTATL